MWSRELKSFVNMQHAVIQLVWNVYTLTYEERYSNRDIRLEHENSGVRLRQILIATFTWNFKIKITFKTLKIDARIDAWWNLIKWRQRWCHLYSTHDRKWVVWVYDLGGLRKCLPKKYFMVLPLFTNLKGFDTYFIAYFITIIYKSKCRCGW